MTARSDEPVVNKLPGKRGVGRPSQVSQAQIFAAISAIGIDNLTLQAIADVLEVTPPALYRHVRSREDMLAKFTGHITERYPVPAYEGGGWPNWAIRFAQALLEMYRAVPGLANYTIRRTHTAHNVLDRHETSIKAAKESGFDELRALYATRAVVEFVAAWVAREQRGNSSSLEPAVHPDIEFRQAVLTMPGKKYPHLRGALRSAEGHEPTDRFHFTLRALVSGLMGSPGREP